MNNFAYDDVSGVVVGDVCGISAVLYYEDRPQCKKRFFKDETEARRAMIDTKRGIVSEQGSLAGMIYPDDSQWSVRISQI